MKKIVCIISLCLCFVSQGMAQSVDKGCQPLNDSTASVKDSLSFEQHVAMIERMKRKIDDKLLRFEAGITGGLRSDNEDYYMVELSAAYYPLKYAGVTFGLEWNDNRGGEPLTVSLKDANGYEEYNPNRIIQINLNPGLAFRTPTLWMNNRHSWGLMLHCKPGLCLSVLPINDIVTFDEVKDSKGVGHPTSFTDYQYGNVVTRTVRNHGGKWCFWRVKSALTVRSGDVFLSLGWIASDYNIEYCRNNIYYTKGKRYNGIDKYKYSGTLFASITGQF